jgi:hypothetical protein
VLKKSFGILSSSGDTNIMQHLVALDIAVTKVCGKKKSSKIGKFHTNGMKVICKYSTIVSNVILICSYFVINILLMK